MLFFFKQKTAYEVRISDWSSDVCSSDLKRRRSACGRRPRAKSCVRLRAGAVIDRQTGSVSAPLTPFRDARSIAVGRAARAIGAIRPRLFDAARKAPVREQSERKHVV